MGLNLFFKTVKHSTNSSYTFLKNHPFASCALLVSTILYMFLSYIYSFLAYLSPFLVCAAIFVRIFWSSEQTQFMYVKREEEKAEPRRVEPRLPKAPNSRRREMLHKYPSQNATSRRRNFGPKKWDVYGGLEEKPKDLSAAFYNEYTARNHTRTRGSSRSFDKGESSNDHGFSSGSERRNQPHRRHHHHHHQVLRSEPSTSDLEEAGGSDVRREKIEEAEDKRNKAVIEWTEDDQRNLMDLGLSELERNKRLESLMQKRKERKSFKLKPENTLADKKTPIPRHIAPILVSSQKNFDWNNHNGNVDVDDDGYGSDMPESATSLVPRSPYDIPYEAGEERPNLTGGSFHQEFVIDPKDIPSEGNQEHGVFHNNPFYNSGRRHHERMAYQRFRRHPERGSHDWLIDNLMYKEGGENGFKAPNSLEKGKEILTQKEDESFKSDSTSMKDEKMENSHVTKSIADHTSEPSPSLIPNMSTDIVTPNVSEKPGLRFVLPHVGIHNFPISTTTTTNVNENDSISSPVKRHENVFFPVGRICHTPTYSIASDLQVEVSEIGSLASTVDENGETNSNTDKESVLYDGDIDRDRDASSGSEELWEASFHGRHNAHGVSEEDVPGASTGMASADALRQIDEESAADVSSMSSRCDVHEDSKTHARNSDHKNIFAYMNYSMGESEAIPSSNPSSSVSSPPKQLMDNSLEFLPNETQSQISEVWSNMSEHLIDGAHVINELNNLEATEQNTTEISRTNNEDPSTSVARQESIDDTSIFSVASSPRSVLPEKTIADEVSSSTYGDQQIISSQESNVEDMVQESTNGGDLHDTMHQHHNQILVDGITDESHSIVDLSHSQEQVNPPESSMEETNILAYMNEEEISNKEEEDMSNNHMNSEEENSSHHIRQEAIAESSNIAGETSTEIKDEKSRELEDDKVH